MNLQCDSMCLGGKPHAYRHIMAVGHYPVVESVLWCPHCGMLLQLVNSVTPEGNSIEVRRSETPPGYRRLYGDALDVIIKLEGEKRP